ncbi:MAG: DUF420 domain-containing protein [Planctomycetota bacterium]
MIKAPLVSTIVAIGLIPVAFLFIHAYLSGIKKWRYHAFTGISAICWDLSMSIGYMIYRALGGTMEGSVIVLKGAVLAYFIVHGIVASAVIILELSVLVTGIIQWKRKTPIKSHRKLATILFPLWWFAFLSGELFYLVVYVFGKHP